MADLLKDLCEIVEERRDEKESGSYTAYLFDSGLDKILKKMGEECSEIIIGAKSLEAEGALGNNTEKAKEELVGEIGDFLYHLTVMMVDRQISFDDVNDLLRDRMKKQGNLKDLKEVDKNT